MTTQAQAITIHLKYFASIREAIGIGSESLVVQGDVMDVGALRESLMAKGEPYLSALSRKKVIRTALNQTMCDESMSLSNNCEVAFFPPVTGG
jgi:molybdopterin synthase sulfur carrier subunit